MNIYHQMSSNGWHIGTPKGCEKRETERPMQTEKAKREGNSRTDLQKHKERGEVLGTDRE